MKFLHTALLFAVFITPLFGQEGPDLLDFKTRRALLGAFNGTIAKQHVDSISRYHRVQASPGYNAAAQYVLRELRKYGFTNTDAWIESYKSDGVTKYQTWQSPSGWDVTGAELSIVSPEQRSLASFASIPMTLMTYSNPGDVTSEVIWVGDGTKASDYKSVNVKGKFVLATGYGGDVHRLAVIRYGAKAVVCFPDDQRGHEHPDMVQYTGLWPRSDELAKTTFGFNISYREGEKLRSMLRAGRKVVLHGSVTGTGLHPDSMQVVVAMIRGKDKSQDELMFSAHLDHPAWSANDNASGAGALLDIARGLRTAIDSNQLRMPRRTFRFLWVPEWYGTMAYIDAHPELKGPSLGGRVLADVNLDMVGENPDLLHTNLSIVQTPSSVPSALNDVAGNMAVMVDRNPVTIPGGSQSLFNYRMVPYSGGSDHMMFLDRKIPSIMLSHGDWTHHTSEDTPAFVDPVELQRCEIIAAGSLWYLANLTAEQAYDLTELLRSNIAGRLGMLARTMYPKMTQGPVRDLPTTWAEVDANTFFSMKREIDAANSILRYFDDADVQDHISSLGPHINRRFAYLYELSRALASSGGYASDFPPPLDDPADTLIPVRATRGPLDFRVPESLLPPARAAWYDTVSSLNPEQRFELINFIDGERSVTELHGLMTMEFPMMRHDVIRRYLDDLVATGLLTWKNAVRPQAR